MYAVAQRRIPPITIGLIGLTLGMSIAVAIDARHGGALYDHLALCPEAVWHGQLWRLVTWPFIQASPIALILACVAIYAFGSDLLLTWGAPRYLRFIAGILLVAGVGTSVVALLLPAAWEISRLGGMVIADVLVIAWARQFPAHPVWVYFVVLVRGPALVSIIVAITLLFAVYAGISWMLPELLAVAAALLYMKGTPRRWWLKLRLARTRRKLRVVR
jgi:membrane associated rhomboid family serine protease